MRSRGPVAPGSRSGTGGQPLDERAALAPGRARRRSEPSRGTALRPRVRNENICSMEGRASHNPRDEAIRAAHHDAAVLAGILTDEFRATYPGPERAEYLRVLASIVADLGGALDTRGSRVAVVFDNRRITIRFGSG